MGEGNGRDAKSLPKYMNILSGTRSYNGAELKEAPGTKQNYK